VIDRLREETKLLNDLYNYLESLNWFYEEKVNQIVNFISVRYNKYKEMFLCQTDCQQ
jgi:hypothetical protein